MDKTEFKDLLIKIRDLSVAQIKDVIVVAVNELVNEGELENEE
jgi:hypothetical protein